MRISSAFAVLFMLASAAGCSESTGPEPVQPGSFRGDVKGDLAMGFDGPAYSGTLSPSFPQNRVYLQDPRGYEIYVRVNATADFPVGRTLIDRSADEIGEAYGRLTTPDERLYASIGGYFDVEAVTAEGIVGTLQFRAFDPNLPSDTVVITAEFHTRRQF